MPWHGIWLRITVEHEALTVSGRMLFPVIRLARQSAPQADRSTAVPLAW
jgi:hypothetical protein